MSVPPELPIAWAAEPLRPRGASGPAAQGEDEVVEVVGGERGEGRAVLWLRVGRVAWREMAGRRVPVEERSADDDDDAGGGGGGAAASVRAAESDPGTSDPLLLIRLLLLVVLLLVMVVVVVVGSGLRGERAPWMALGGAGAFGETSGALGEARGARGCRLGEEDGREGSAVGDNDGARTCKGPRVWPSFCCSGCCCCGGGPGSEDKGGGPRSWPSV